ncbi:MAG TPA: 16S rRNA (adenine(1518)-N(6)/adenine(1519)-N(6))-dimethyltransferase RsmA [Dongiaceae bacterium]|nr:16S rRNA (adenine(1518)-N(6)/adenine(1519)-N(6))-dimethyltransferase RsmA [Dongiaceae bacterium]
MARQKLGQHFLGDAGWREKIARAIRVSRHGFERPDEPAANYCWIEIGAGHGEMTQHLAATGAPVIAVELDPPLIARLGDLAARFPNLTVAPGDVLQTDLAALAAGRRIRLYGNLPYYITSPILHHFFASAALIEEIHIVIQIEVAFRLVARPGTRDYGYLSVLTQYFSRPSLALKIPPSAFRPPPEVGSALVSMKLPGESAALALSQAEEAAFLDFVKACFSQKRKTLLNNLRGHWQPDAIRGAIGEMKLSPSARAEELTVAQLAKLFAALRTESQERRD